MKILIIDDSRTSRAFIIDALENQGYTFGEAADGIEGLKKIEEISPDIIILDLLMPNMNGFEVLEILKSKRNKVPVIVLTADIQDDVKNECLALGAMQFITKPFNSNDLTSAIKNII